MSKEGLEPSLPKKSDFKSDAATNYATRSKLLYRFEFILISSRV